MAMSPGSPEVSRRSPLSSPVQLQSVGGFENENVQLQSVGGFESENVQLQSVGGFESENNRTSFIVTAECTSNNIGGGRARGSSASVWDEKPPSFLENIFGCCIPKKQTELKGAATFSHGNALFDEEEEEEDGGDKEEDKEEDEAETNKNFEVKTKESHEAEPSHETEQSQPSAVVLVVDSTQDQKPAPPQVATVLGAATTAATPKLSQLIKTLQELNPAMTMDDIDDIYEFEDPSGEALRLIGEMKYLQSKGMLPTGKTEVLQKTKFVNPVNEDGGSSRFLNENKKGDSRDDDRATRSDLESLRIPVD